MTEDELTKVAWEIFNDVLDEIEFPSYVQVAKQDDGSVAFTLLLSDNKIGLGSFYYKPSIEIVKEIIKNLGEGAEKIIGKKVAGEFTYTIAGCYVFELLKNFHIDVLETFQNFSELPLLLLEQLNAKAFSLSYQRTPDNKKDLLEKAARSFDSFFHEKTRNLKRRLLESLESASDHRKPVKHLIAHFYSFYLPEWNEAKKFFKKNRNYSSWEKMLVIAFPELPLDLVDRLSDSDPYNSMPSSIALEHAARVCGIEDDSVGLRTLQQYLKESREWIQENGEEAKEREVDKYTEWVIGDIFTSYRVADSIGIEPNFNNFPLIHQTINEMVKEPIIKAINEISEKE